MTVSDDHQTLLFWSGGKDSLLALDQLQSEGKEVTLLTTFNEDTDVVPHQDIPAGNIRKQALALQLPLIMVPLPPQPDNQMYLELVKTSIRLYPISFQSLAFGDWHLEDIRNWRLEQFSEMGCPLLFPIWKKPFLELLDRLMELPVQVQISSVSTPFARFIRTGQIYDREFVKSLPGHIDPMGENGEFHTEVMINSGL